ncbi:MAG TPA: hypothetical protein EYP10_05600 [Armatimonadetes bacterium]|nr:hypothetical protein [Armatimonadota bacterium]
MIPERHWLTDDDGIRKPDPRALWLVLDRIGARRAIYIGDAVDDLDTVKNYCEWAPSGYPRVLFCAVLTGPVGERNRSFFMERSADMVAPNVNFVLDYMRAVREWQTVVARSER